MYQLHKTKQRVEKLKCMSKNTHAENQCKMKNPNGVFLCISCISRESTLIKRSEPLSFDFINKIDIEKGLTTFNKNRKGIHCKKTIEQKV